MKFSDWVSFSFLTSFFSISGFRNNIDRFCSYSLVFVSQHSQQQFFGISKIANSAAHNLSILFRKLDIQKIHTRLSPLNFYNCEVALYSLVCFPIRFVLHQYLNSQITYPGVAHSNLQTTHESNFCTCNRTLFSDYFE